MKIKPIKFFTIIIIVLLFILTIFIVYRLQQKNDFSKSKFYGSETFDFCGEDLENYKGCKKFCEELTGINCITIHLKVDKIEKGKCYYIYPQVGIDDPCQHCSIMCEPL